MRNVCNLGVRVPVDNFGGFHDADLLDDLGRMTYGLFSEEIISPSPNPDAYTEYGTDILGLRVSRPVGPVEIGAAMRFDSGLWWYSLADIDIPALNDWIDTTGSTSDWFALGKSEWLCGGDVSATFGPVSCWVEYLDYRYTGGVTAGNKENDARDGNGPIDLDMGDRGGHLSGADIEIRALEFLGLGLNYSSQLYSTPDKAGVYLQPGPSTDGDGRVEMEYLTMAPNSTASWWEGLEFRLNLDRYFPILLFGGKEQLRDDFTGMSRDTQKFGFSAKGSFLWDFIVYDLYSHWAKAEYGDGATGAELLSKYAIDVCLTDNWYIGLDVAYHSASEKTEGDSTLFDGVSMPVFTYVQFRPVENVRMEIFWGVHPMMANGWIAGRREFIDEYIRENGASFVEAWEELEDVRQIGFRGEIDF